MTKEEKLARKQQRKAEKVGLGKLLLWNSSSCSVALSTLMLGYATFYCTDVLQLAPALVGTLFMVSKIFDSFTDIVAGFIVDRTQTRWGKGRPYEIFYVVPVAVHMAAVQLPDELCYRGQVHLDLLYVHLYELHLRYVPECQQCCVHGSRLRKQGTAV